MFMIARYPGKCIETGVSYGEGTEIEKVEGGYRVVSTETERIEGGHRIVSLGSPEENRYLVKTKICWQCGREVTRNRIKDGGDWNDTTAGTYSCYCGC